MVWLKIHCEWSVKLYFWPWRNSSLTKRNLDFQYIMDSIELRITHSKKFDLEQTVCGIFGEKMGVFLGAKLPHLHMASATKLR